MKEDFLHYVWNFRKLEVGQFFTSEHESLHINNPGSPNVNSGPDFFNAQIELNGQVWAGNVEIHIKSSDWYAHAHERDPAYDNVILHVVWEHDAEVFRKNGTAIPTFILKNHIPQNTLRQYLNLFSKGKKWINCESDLGKVDSFIMENWLERLYFERLQKRETLLRDELENSRHHWESLLFRMLCKNFGLKVNGESFFSIAKSIDYSVLQKCGPDRQQMEALLLGQAGLLDGEKEDWYFKTLKTEYEYLRHKFGLTTETVVAPKFFRLRPPNFPTLRLAQLAMLYSEQANLFSKINAANTKREFYALFNICASDYWSKHYNFGVSSLERKKRITKSFVDLLILNTIIPIKFCYARWHGNDVAEEILKLASEIAPEENIVVKKFNSLRNSAANAYQSQALLQLKTDYCDKNRCLQCAMGNSILNPKEQTGLNPSVEN